MIKLELHLQSVVRQRFPDFGVGGFLVSDLEGITPHLTTQAPIEMARARSVLVEEGLDIQSLVNDPRIAAWRDAYRRCGLKPSTYKSSAEQLGRRVLRGEQISTPLAIVTTYCALAACHLATLGGYDLVKLPEAGVQIRFAKPGVDSFIPLGGRAGDMALTSDVVVYASQNEVLCFSFNHRDSKNTCLTLQTSQAVFFGEGVTEAQVEAARKALTNLQALLREAGAKVGEIKFIDKESMQTQLTIEG